MAARINVVVAATRRDMVPEGIAAAVLQRDDMVLAGGGVMSPREADAAIEGLPRSQPCALIVVGPAVATAVAADAWLARRPDLVVLRVAIPEKAGDREEPLRIAVHGLGLPELLEEVRALVDRVGGSASDRVQSVHLQLAAPREAPSPPPTPPPPPRPLLDSALRWVHALLRGAILALPEARGDVPWFTLTRANVLAELDQRARGGSAPQAPDIDDALAALESARAAADPSREPLARLERALALDALELRLLLLALAPEIDPVYQRCVGVLLDDAARRMGTLGLYVSLLGLPADVRARLAHGGALTRWRLFEGPGGTMPFADEPLRVEPTLVGWILGKPGALAGDAHLRRVTLSTPWRGADLLGRDPERRRALEILEKARAADTWTILDGDDAAAWRALLELGASAQDVMLARVDGARVGNLDAPEREECALRLARLARLEGAVVVIDAGEGPAAEEHALRAFVDALGSAGVRGAIVAGDEARAARLLGGQAYEIPRDAAFPRDALIEAVRAAARGADAYLNQDMAARIATQFPLGLDALEQAMRLAASRPLDRAGGDAREQRFLAACKDVAAECVSRIAERIEPAFRLQDVVLPADRRRQLVEIVDSVRLAPKVFEGWKFGEQLPYGRGVTVLFHGPSGTGKTMAAMGVARELGVQILRLDLSRVVSKYIGETEKNIDEFFEQGRRSFAALLFDEADALFGKRSEVKDAHDRYANIEVAFLLQRMEAYEGLAILTTNLRQNLDAAFLRRLRFIVEFPRPDAEAREKIWRRCLPDGSHTLGDAEFRQLARRIELTGGHIRQVTLRAAFLAAAADTSIGMGQIAAATEAELAKLGLPPADIDLARNRRAA